MPSPQVLEIAAHACDMPQPIRIVVGFSAQKGWKFQREVYNRPGFYVKKLSTNAIIFCSVPS